MFAMNWNACVCVGERTRVCEGLSVNVRVRSLVIVHMIVCGCVCVCAHVCVGVCVDDVCVRSNVIMYI